MDGHGGGHNLGAHHDHFPSRPHGLEMNFINLCGLMAGKPDRSAGPGLRHGMCGSEDPSIAYASVYPLTMVLRIAAAQMLVLFFAS